MEIIQSRQNALVKTCVKLASHRRERLKSGVTLLDGPHLIRAALDAGLPPQRLLVAAGAVDKPEIVDLLGRFDGVPAVLADTLFGELTELESSSGILAVWPVPAAPAPRRDGLVLALDGVQDPGNVGAMLRTAAAAGVAQAWLSPACADAWSPKVLRAGMGAHFLLPLVERADLPALLADFGGRRAATLLQGSVPLYAADLRGDLALVMGSEGGGVSEEVAALTELRLRIPMRAGLESLNVGAAAAICLYERLRQAGGEAVQADPA
ncbi:TrmH family RNA methyltransferase [Chitinimonas koreensis]|uniref:TrmH family RNA methyltransferase n=1 Tax=Chitinimonas koreensis TaxID=356302 RepID=UPI000424B32B|nr:RNA methyltransferase [Chitinimonas koreensis]QNM98271.1 RNA methyltransferase [Chitinimonas koreensis]